jgi:regulatory protein
VIERLDAGEITEEEAVDLAREAVLRTLTAAPKSRRELEQSLARKGYPDQVAGQVLDRLAKVGLINDADYADLIVRTRHSERGLSRRAIAVELRRRGIDADQAAAALDQIDDNSERQAARALAEKLVTKNRHCDKDVQVRRAVSALARRGYSPSLAYDAVKQALETQEMPEWDGAG